MKRVLILAIGCNVSPWDKMFQTSLNTWDSIEVEGVETIFYFGNPVKTNTDKAIYFPVKENYYTMGDKMLSAFEWALENKQFDYVARINSSCFVDKKELIKYVQTLQDDFLFEGLVVPKSETAAAWVWGGGQYIISRDVIRLIVDNKNFWNDKIMEDMALSEIVTKIGVPFSNGKAVAINKKENGWLYTCYGTESFESEEIVKAEGQYFYRVKNDSDRTVDKYIMESLFNKIK